MFLSRNIKKYQIFLSENFHFLVVKFSAYLNRLVFVMVFVILTSSEIKANCRSSETNLSYMYARLPHMYTSFLWRSSFLFVCR